MFHLGAYPSSSGRPAYEIYSEDLSQRASWLADALGGLTDHTLSTMLDSSGPVLTRKYAVTIAWFSMLSLFLNATRTPLETTDKIGSRTSPLANRSS